MYAALAAAAIMAALPGALEKAGDQDLGGPV
jgi:hypothetical protein